MPFDLTLPEAQSYPPRILAHLGDGVYELWLREVMMALVADGQLNKVEKVHTWTTQRASAAFQVKLLQALLPQLTETEQQVVKRARNSAVSVSRRSQQSLHRQSTGFEALIGYWYCVDKARLWQCLDWAKPYVLSGEAPETESASDSEET